MLAFSDADAGGVTYARSAKNTHHEMSTKPDRFADQIDAEAKANEFCEGVARAWREKIPGVTIDSRHFERGDGWAFFVWGNSGMRLLATAVITRDARNYSLLVTKVCEIEPSRKQIRPCDQCEHFRPLPDMASAATQKAWKCCALGHAQDFKAPGESLNDPWGLHRPGCEDYAKARE